MTLPHIKRALTLLSAIIAIILICRATHFLFPNLWLPKTAEALRVEDQRHVSPHIYDSQWFDAARAGRGDITDTLIKAGFPINTHTNAGYTALALATYHGNLDEVNLLLSAGADPCIPDQNGNSALMGALFKGEMRVAERLVDLCQIDVTNGNGQTALSFAALFGRMDMLEQLVQRGADLEHKDAKGNSIKMIVKAQGNDKAISELERLRAKYKSRQ